MNDNRTRSWCPISRLETMGAPGKDRKTADQVKIILSAIRKFSRAMTKKDSVTLGHVDFVWESLDIDRNKNAAGKWTGQPQGEAMLGRLRRLLGDALFTELTSKDRTVRTDEEKKSYLDEQTKTFADRALGLLLKAAAAAAADAERADGEDTAAAEAI